MNPGLTTTIANYFNSRQQYIVLEDRGLHPGFARMGQPPYSKNRFQILPEFINGSNLSIFLGDKELEDGFFFIQRSAAYITNYLYFQEHKIKLKDYFIYLIADLILRFYINTIRVHETTHLCPQDSQPYPENILKMIKRAHLCPVCEEQISQFMNRGGIDPEFLSSVRTILQSLAREYQEIGIKAVDDLTMDDSAEHKLSNKKAGTDRSMVFDAKEMNSEVKEQTKTIKSDTEIKARKTYRTGDYFLHHNAENPPDSLGYEDYASALASVITNENTETPLTIGICAPWGRGKTTLLGYIVKKVNQIGKMLKKRFVCIEFNAWEHSKSKYIWIEFYTKIIKDIEKNLGFFGRLSFRLSFYLKVYKSRIIIFISFLIALLFIFLMFSFRIKDVNIYTSYPNFNIRILYIFDYLSEFFGLYFGGIITFFSLPIIYNLFQSITKKLFSGRINKLFDTETKFQNEIQRRLNIVGNKISKFKLKRFIIFIDDIDRCMHNQILEILESIRIFLKVKNFVYLVSLDANVVRFAIGEHYKFMGEEPHQKEDMGRYYLEKIIEVPFHLPSVDKDKLKNLSNEIISKFLRENRKTPEPLNAKADAKDLDFAKSIEKDQNLLSEQQETIIKDSDIKDTSKQSVKIIDNRMWLDEDEKNLIDKIISTDDFDFSPRLLKRFINIYLIARHLYISDQIKNTGAKEVNPPPDSFTKWLAISVLMPFETKALMEWWELHNWDYPFGDGKVFKNSKFIYSEPSQENSLQKDSPFKCLDLNSLDKLAKLYSALQIEYKVVKNTRNITSCFNLILD